MRKSGKFFTNEKIDYKIEIQDRPQTAPKGKLPAIEYQGELIPDSSDILKFLAEHFSSAKKLMQLKKADVAKAHAMRRMLEEHLYFCLAYFRWIPEKNWAITKKAYFSFLSSPLRLFIPELARKQVQGQLHAQGIGRHSTEEIAERALEDLRAVESLMGSKGYALGLSKPSFLDATVFGILSGFAWPASDSPARTFVLQSKFFSEMDPI